MNEYKDTDTDWVVEAQNGDSAKWSYVPGLARIAGGDPSSGAYQYQLRDRLGSVRDIRSQAKARLAEYTFEPYGDVWSSSGLALNQGFTGHTWDAALGMYHTAFRHYSPGMARWMSRDPLGMVDGPNLYGYVGGDPVNFWDLLGGTAVAIPDCVQRFLQKHFPKLDMSKITIVTNAQLPEGMAGQHSQTDINKILVADDPSLVDKEGILLVAHELKHRQQVRRRTRPGFWLQYGAESIGSWLAGDGIYPEKRGLEKAAYEFEEGLEDEMVGRAPCE